MGFKLLYVDDDIKTPKEDDFKYKEVNFALEDKGVEGIDVQVARNVADACNRLVEECFDAVILDIHLPISDESDDSGEWKTDRPDYAAGIEILDLIAGKAPISEQYNALKNTPIVAILTGVSVREVVDEIEENMEEDRMKLFFKPKPMADVISYIIDRHQS